MKGISLFIRENQITFFLSSGFAFLLCGFIMAAIFSKELSDHFGITWFQFLYNEQTGVYADCSVGANKNLPRCRPKVSKSTSDWNQMMRTGGKNTPFTLHKGN